MSIHPIKGRPFGGRSFIVNKRIKIIKYEFINRFLATLTCCDYNRTFSIISCYFPFDNGSQLNLSEFQSCLQVAFELLCFFENLKHTVFIIGDFNADLLRKKRFDLIFMNFIIKNNLTTLSNSFNPFLSSYMKGDYVAKLDHCLTSLPLINFKISKSEYMDDVINLSDHKPLLIKIIWNSKFIFQTQSNENLFCNKIITLPPNFDNPEIKEKFNNILSENFENFVNTPIIDLDNKQSIIDTMYTQLTSTIKLAYESCSRVVSIESVKNNKNWYTNELKILKNEMLLIRYKLFRTTEDNNNLKILKKKFRNVMKRNIFLYEKNEFFKIGNLIKANNSEKFFKNVNNFLKKNKKCELNINEVVSHYDSIFNEPLNVDADTAFEVEAGIVDLKHENYMSINISRLELVSALSATSMSKVLGDDGLSSYMLLNLNQRFVISYILYFYQFIFKYGVIPKNFNNIHIVPIIKDKSKHINDLSNLRPISISNTLAQIFERLIKAKIPLLGKTHQNQFGYKNKTSCTHALFAFKELAVKCIESKKHLFALKLDAVKAFDRLWRDALFFKVKKKINYLCVVILLKIYYDNLQARIKIDKLLSHGIQILRGVKQGGVLSGDLFNCFIDDLIVECCNSGFGAQFIEIVLCIIGFCDDICLLSCSSNDLRKLLSICELFARKWGIEFNISKCKFIVFGSSKYNDSVFFFK